MTNPMLPPEMRKTRKNSKRKIKNKDRTSRAAEAPLATDGHGNRTLHIKLGLVLAYSVERQEGRSMEVS